MSASNRGSRVICDTCPHACRLAPGEVGRCRARGWQDGRIGALAYGHISSFALDPVEKKPFANWMGGKLLLSAGSYGCNLSCPFCQNYQISQAGAHDVDCFHMPPGKLVNYADEARVRDERVVGIAHTYNEPLLNWEYVGDTGMLAHRLGLYNVLVSNGYANAHVINKLAPLIDAANIDLKGFTEEYYRWCGGDLATVKATVERLAAEPSCHLEVTCLIVAGHNDDPQQMDALASWLATVDAGITLHVTRCFPNWKMRGEPPTPVAMVYALADVARRHLAHVAVGNV